MTIEEARQQLRAFALVYALRPDNGQAQRELEAAAREFAKACQNAASGVSASEHQAVVDKKRGKRLCASCALPVMPCHGNNGVEWLNENFTVHRCGR